MTEPRQRPCPTPRSASEWLVALRESPADRALQASLDAWLAASEANRLEWQQCQRTWSMLGQLPGWSMPPVPVSAGRRRTGRTRRRLLALAASLFLAWTLAAAWPALFGGPAADFATGTAQLRTITLGDGSTARLGPRSALSFDMDDASRTARLLTGRAYFEVQPDRSRPFQVEGGALSATVLGTAFEVRRDDGPALVAVHEGRVSVDLPGEETRLLEAGGVLRLGDDGVVRTTTMPAAFVASWRDGLLVARDAELGAVVAELRRFFPGAIVLLGDDLARQRVTGLYDLNRPRAALDAIAGSLHGQVRSLSPWLLIISG